MRKTNPSERKGYILRLRESRTLRGISMTLALTLLFEMIQPTVSMALTEGPSQPEVQSFEPIGTTQMVDLFTGDFNYNIPLFNLPGPNGGYPVNLAYHAGVSMDDEASWVGLGWNLNVGALVRNMRGLPDEFLSAAYNSDGTTNGIEHAEGDWKSGDYIETKTDMKESWTIGASFEKKFEILGGNVLAGFDAEKSISVRFNNYRGLGMSVGYSVSPGENNSSPLSAGLSLDSDNGLGVSASLNLSKKFIRLNNDFKLGLSFDGEIALSASLSKKDGTVSGMKIRNGKRKSAGLKRGYGSSLSFARSNFTPSIGYKMNTFNLSGGISFGGNANVIHSGKGYSIFYNTQDYDDAEKTGKKRPVVGYAKNEGEQSFYTKDFVRMNDGQITNDNAVLPHSYYSYDSYASSGQGLSGYFRGKRNDIGRIHDPQLKNESFGVSVNFEFFKQTAMIQMEPAPPEPLQPSYILTDLSKHIGVGANVNFGYNYQGVWNENNELDDNFTNPYPGGIRENHYYQAHGEQTVFEQSDLDYMNGVDLALVQFSPKDNVFNGKRKITVTENPHIQSSRPYSKGRVVRNTLIHSLNNDEVKNLGEFDVQHYEFNASLDLSQEPRIEFDRSARTPDNNSADVSIDDHNAGFKVLNEDGSYYVYALPAYNKKEVENLFTVESPSGDPAVVDVVEEPQTNEVKYKQPFTQKFINKTTKSPYAHSYMLTSVQGADYVDVKNDGPTVDDMGYWVKFSYVKYGDRVKWRSPYYGASYNRGSSYTGEDDKASYQYGEKELWYMGRMETKSHIAIFEMSEREDMKEASGEFANVVNGMGTQSGLRIDVIKIYERATFEESTTTPVPLQVVHFDYDYSLCKETLNSSAVGKGKLTLKKVWFTSLNSNRGSLSPYEFDYTSVNIDPTFASDLDGSDPNGVNLVNPEYQQNSYDPWGNYRPYADGYLNHANFSYVAQSSHSWKQTWMNFYPDLVESKANKDLTQLANDLISSCWSLREIKLPSGGTINIEYESDDYSHVQHKVANQLFKIDQVGNGAFGLSNVLYDPGTLDDFENNPALRRIYFKLEEPIEVSPTIPFDPNLKVYNDYVEPIMKDENGDRNLYFKSLVNLKGSGSTAVKEFISGYLKLEEYSNTVQFHGVDLSSNQMIDGVDSYTRAYVTIETVEKRNGNKFENYHPIALRAWEYMQTNAPELLNPATLASSQNNSIQNVGDLLGMVTSLVGVIPATTLAFGAIRPYCHGLGFAASIDLENSGIRLASPDRKKFGGGHRVKQISISDEWSSDTGSSEQSRTYGQVYDYTSIDDKTGRTISSGVAQYEPQAGGDENALKYPINYFGKQNLLTNNNLMAEAPMNEALFPGAMVGYRKVTVRSLNTSDQMNKFIDPSETPEGRTGGIAEHEFFTAKDFPTMVTWSELHPSNNTKDVFNVTIPLPFIGSIKRNYYHGSQAFKIELNDMHGKPKSVKSYELNAYQRNAAPITESFYEYQSADISYQGETVKMLVNSVNVIPKSSGQDLTNMESRLMGVETDLFTDQRENKSFSSSIGLDFNIDLLSTTAVPIPLPSVWPSYTNHKTLFRTYVTNKVVHRSGILKKTKTRNLQTVNESEVLAYDEKAGTPLVSRVKNEFGDYFYSYNVPAYYHYDRMGHAYQNINYTFSVDVGEIDAVHPTDPNIIPNFDGQFNSIANVQASLPIGSNAVDHLVRGDELLITDVDNGFPGNKYKKGYFLGWKYNGSGEAISAIIQLVNVYPSNTGIETLTFKVIRSGRRNHYGSMAANYLTKGELTTTGSLFTVDGTVGNLDFVQTNIIGDNVLSATASLFKDDWTTIGGANLSVDAVNGPHTDNPFMSGNSGIFRPYKSYTYVGPRKGNANMHDNTDPISQNPKLYEDGIMTNVPMFTWDLGNIEDYVSNWEWVNEVTRFSTDAYEIENVNRLGIYSSALYGYDNSLTIGVGGNASSFELGVFDFETSSTATPEKLLSQTNMDFSSNASTAIITEQHTITKATMSGSNVLTIQTKIPFVGFDIADYVDNMGLSVITRKGAAPKTNEGFYFNARRTGVSSYTGTDGVSYVQFTATPFIEQSGTASTTNLLPPNSSGYGKITLMTIKGNVSSVTNASYSTDKAHTGKVSLKVEGQSQYDQAQLKMIKDKKYVVSIWVSSDKRKRTYENDNLVKIGTMQGGSYVTMGISNTEITEIKTTYSKVIEGWQKVDFEFEVIAANATLVLDFNNASGEITYVDDVRFSPRTGGITTYVYDPNRFWLRASLNVDNYATFFYYDEEGNLTIKKQETEEGIFTITESRGHVSE
ncbi:MAG: hypothetical protein HRT58_22025 [Crocinitomicaceae bacterium]|nr:hypothetical protein [Flavobacteriales bacterium]NQZ38354.1 hypothetical protein [Crocinitomicaceae bacterium]